MLVSGLAMPIASPQFAMGRGEDVFDDDFDLEDDDDVEEGLFTGAVEDAALLFIAIRQYSDL
jgi:hypothetical protein